MLTISGLKVSYEGIQALRGIDLEIETGQMVALIGSNGAGKSTLLNCISGLVRPQSGIINFIKSPIIDRAAHKISRLGILHVPEGRQILGELSVLDNLLLGRIALGKRNATFSIDKVCDLFPVLRERKMQRAGSLSGGEQQMLAIGRALMGAPRLLLLDEPSLGLSPVVSDKVFSVLSELNDSGLTILLVEQNARRALEVTNFSYVMERGMVVMSGSSKDLLHEPRVIEHYLGIDPSSENKE